MVSRLSSLGWWAGQAGRFYGRYWGSFKHVDFLHFVCCYYSSVDYCIRNGLDVMEAGG